MITIRFLRVRYTKVVCVYKSALNCCVRFQRVKSNYYNDDLLSRRISVVRKISLSLLERGGHNDNKKNTDFEKEKRQKSGCSFFLRQNLFLRLFSGAFVKKNNLVCKLSSL